MAVDIKLKRSHTHSTIPTTSDLAEGEFAVNTYDRKLYMRDGSNEIVTVSNHYATDFDSSTKIFYVTVATSTTDHPYHGTGSSNKYKINGIFSPIYILYQEAHIGLTRAIQVTLDIHFVFILT